MLFEMDIEGMGTEEQLVLLCSSNDANNHVAKGKRTKRLRPLSPCAVAATAVTSSCSSANSDEHLSAGGESGSFSSTTTIFKSTTNQEEEDMAKCLILLAQGKGGEDDVDGNKNKNTENVTTATITVAATATAVAKKIGFYIYECKTCNKTFQSFQALGGHRASHKRPKVTVEEKETLPPPSSSASPPLITNFEFEVAKETHIKSSRQIPITLQLGCGNNRGFHGNKAKIHECSICGSEFTSGQALGGHMRRHRASTNTSDGATAATVEVKPRNVLELDLNLPAPEEDVRDSKFQFTATTQKSMLLSPAPALVGCHY